jgi:hypothetical protein
MSVYSKFLEVVSGVPRTVDLSQTANTLGISALQLLGSTSGNISQTSSATTTSYSVVWPSAVSGTAGFALTSDTSGNLSWTSVANQALSNLSATSVNTAIIPSTSAINLGSVSIPWGTVFTQNVNNPLIASNLSFATSNQTGSNASGSLTLTAGNTVNATAGNVVITAGTATGSGTSGFISVGSATNFNSNTITGALIGVGSSGTGQTSFTTNQVILGGSTSTGALQQVSAGTSGQVLTSNGASAPTWQNAGAGFYRAGVASLSASTTSKAITFSSSFSNTSYAIHAQLQNTTDANPQFQPVTITAQATTGFTATWDGQLDTANYSLTWMAMVNN